MTDTETTTMETVEIQEIMQLLPHRYPFLMIDRIIGIRSDEYAIGIKNVTINEPHFLGHFPENPIMPGVLLIEGMAQTAGAICSKEHYDGEPKSVFFMTIDQAKFRAPVRPGDVVEFHLTKQKRRRDIFKYLGVAMVGETKVAEAVVGAMMVAR
ncbi:MAG: 3-hydroxyacyl-ACP dehydratase FabZ [Pseudomonadota bacterium]